MKSAELAGLLGDERTAVRKRAAHELSKSGQKAVGALATSLKHSNSAEMRRNTIWALTQIDAPAARKAVRTALEDKDQSVGEVAIHSASLWRDAAAEKQLLGILQVPNPQLQRVAAEALGRI